MSEPPAFLPLTPTTVVILGHRYSPRSTIWAGLMWHEAMVRENGIAGSDHHLAVPWTHISDPHTPGESAIYRVRARDGRYRVARATNGNWVLELRPPP